MKTLKKITFIIMAVIVAAIPFVGFVANNFSVSAVGEVVPYDATTINYGFLGNSIPCLANWEKWRTPSVIDPSDPSSYTSRFIQYFNFRISFERFSDGFQFIPFCTYWRGTPSESDSSLSDSKNFIVEIRDPEIALIDWNTHYAFDQRYRFILGTSTYKENNVFYQDRVYMNMQWGQYFSGNVIGVRLMVAESSYLGFSSQPDCAFFRINYFDENYAEYSGNLAVHSICFEFRVPRKYLQQFGTRYYFFESSFEHVDGYDAGYSSGFAAGEISGKWAGYNQGYEVGYINGNTNGYNEGVNATNTFTFNSLLGSVIDAPVSVFKSIFNFDILGVNILTLLFSIFTVIVIICIIRLTKGGGHG